MSYHRNTTRSQSSIAATQRSYVVRIDAGALANVEIVIVGAASGSGYHRKGGWTPPRSPTVTPTSKSHGYTHVPIPSTPPAKRSPFSPLQTPPPAPPDAQSKRTYERERIAEQRRMTEEKRAREEIQRRRREEARLAEARRAAAAAKEDARRRRRHAEQQRQEQQKQKEEERALRKERQRRRLERARLAQNREIASAWRSYEARWGLLSQSQRQPERGLGLLGALTFERIPWPVPKGEDAARLLRPDGTAQALDALRPEAIREFLLSSAHSPDVAPKDRIRAALRRWHPDKFARVLSLVIESDRDAVAEGMGIVVRCLNDMLERENHA